MATVTFNALQWRLREGTYFEVSADGASWDPSGDTADKIRALAPLLGFVLPGSETVAVADHSEASLLPIDRVAQVAERVGLLLQVLPHVGRAVNTNLLMPRQVLVEISSELNDFVAEAG